MKSNASDQISAADQMRKRIIDAAVHLFDKGGIQAVSMRKIAERIGYSPAAIYLYFKGKNDILLALVDRGFERLHARQVAVGPAENPKDRLLALCRAYIDFALDEPHYHYLMFFDPEVVVPQESEAHQGSPAQRSYLAMQDAMNECYAHGLIQGGDPLIATAAMAATMHGIAATLTGKRMVLIPEDQRATIAENVLRFVLR